MEAALPPEEEEEGRSKLALPFDMWFEVLTRTSMDSLASAASACRGWNRLSYEPCVLRRHSHQTHTLRGFFMQGGYPHYKSTFFHSHPSAADEDPLSLEFLPEKPVQIEASAPNGLLCCVSRRYGPQPRYFVCKPATKDWLELPKPKLRFFTRDMGMVVLATRPALHFKIVRLSWENNFVTHAKCEIFDSRKCMWRELGDVRLESECLVLPSRQGVVVNGVYHCLTVDPDRSRILAFDIAGESWRLMELPDRGLQQVRQKRLVSMGGKLALVAEGDGERMDVWTLLSHSGERWEREETTRTSLMTSLLGKARWFDNMVNEEIAYFLQSDFDPWNRM